MTIIFIITFYIYIFLLIISTIPTKKPNLKEIIGFIEQRGIIEKYKLSIVKNLAKNKACCCLFEEKSYKDLMQKVKPVAHLYSNFNCSVLLFAQTRTRRYGSAGTLLFYNFDSNYLNFIIETLITKLHTPRHRLWNIQLHITINGQIKIKIGKNRVLIRTKVRLVKGLK